MYHPYHQFLRDEISPLNTQGFWGPPEPLKSGCTNSPLVSLVKQDFRPLCNGGLSLHDRRFENKEAFIVFIVDYCMPCQDTKQMWQAFAIEASELIDSNSPRIATDYVQYIMFKRRDGVLVEYQGPFNIAKLKRLLSEKGLNR